jgi:hypothetical protein
MILELSALTVENMAKLNKANGVLKYKLYNILECIQRKFTNLCHLFSVTHFT